MLCTSTSAAHLKHGADCSQMFNAGFRHVRSRVLPRSSSFSFVSDLDLTTQKLKKSSLETTWEDF